ncbi:pyridine nucleotide-disulfide oxidoreductase dimerization region, partial [mine drainage metagenome]
VLFEKGTMGGDCLNYGCIPSKALLAAAHTAHGVAQAGRYGIRASAPDGDFAAVMRRVHAVIGQIAPHDSVERLERLGVRVIGAPAQFTGREEVAGAGITVRAHRFVIAAGSAARIPPVRGIDQIGALTNETLFSLRRRPEHLLILGGGPVGVE